MTSFRALSTLLVLPISLAFVGCAAAQDDEEVAETESELTANPNAGYFVFTRHDNRRCVSPLCGGIYVKRANQAVTRCADGSYQNECYVSRLDLDGIDVSDEDRIAFATAFASGHGVVRAFTRSSSFNGVRIGYLRVTEAWDAVGDVPVTGSFYRVGDNGTRCVTTPCPSTSAFTLNTRDSLNIVSVNFGTVGSASERAEAQRAMVTSTGFLAAGGLALPKCRPESTNCGPFVGVEDFYLPLKKSVPAPRSCGSRGLTQCNPNEYCSYAPAAICGRADAPGTCAVRPQACTMIYKPVCGCDGATYSNACAAAAAGISVDKDGACPEK